MPGRSRRESIPSFLREIREKSGESQKELAVRANIAPAQISQIEGNKRFHLRRLARISKAYRLNKKENAHLEKLVLEGRWLREAVGEVSAKKLPKRLSSIQGNVPDFLRSKRETLGETQTQVAKRGKMSSSQIGQIEVGSWRFSPNQFDKVSQAYQLNKKEKSDLKALANQNRWRSDKKPKNNRIMPWPKETTENEEIPFLLHLFYMVTRLSKEERDDLLGMVNAWTKTSNKRRIRT